MLFVRREDYSPEASWRLLEWCRAHGADEFGLAFRGPPYLPGTRWAAADEMLVPFRRRVASSGDRWTLTGESATVLRELLPDGLFGLEDDAASPHDPTIYRGARVLLAIATRDGEGRLDVSADEEASLERAGLPVHRERRA